MQASELKPGQRFKVVGNPDFPDEYEFTVSLGRNVSARRGGKRRGKAPAFPIYQIPASAEIEMVCDKTFDDLGIQ